MSFELKQSTLQAVGVVVRGKVLHALSLASHMSMISSPFTADHERREFMESLALLPGISHNIHRHRVFEDVVDLYPKWATTSRVPPEYQV